MKDRKTTNVDLSLSSSSRVIVCTMSTSYDLSPLCTVPFPLYSQYPLTCTWMCRSTLNFALCPFLPTYPPLLSPIKADPPLNLYPSNNPYLVPRLFDLSRNFLNLNLPFSHQPSRPSLPFKVGTGLGTRSRSRRTSSQGRNRQSRWMHRDHLGQPRQNRLDLVREPCQYLPLSITSHIY